MSKAVVRLLVAAGVAGLVAIASCTGDAGPTGPAGATGATGATGSTGTTGPTEVEVFKATLVGTGEVPSNASTGTGTAIVTVSGGLISFRVDVGNIQNVILSHIHGPATTSANAPVRVNFYVPPSGTTPLNFTTTTTLASGVAPLPIGISQDSMVTLIRNGNAYVNVHTSQLPAGEIRGQLVKGP